MPSDDHAKPRGASPPPPEAPTHPLSRTAVLATGGLLGRFGDRLVFRRAALATVPGLRRLSHPHTVIRARSRTVDGATPAAPTRGWQ